jgi:hypothetical protein
MNLALTLNLGALSKIRTKSIARELDITAKQGQEYLEMERSVVGLAEMIDKMESFADPEDMANLRNTLEMVAKMLNIGKMESMRLFHKSFI